MTELHEKCLRCGRKLKTEESKILGFGKICWEKYTAEDNFQQLFEVGDNNAFKQFNNDIQTSGST